MKDIQLFAILGLFVFVAAFATALPFEDTTLVTETDITSTIEPTTVDSTTPEESTSPEESTTIEDISTTEPPPVLCDAEVDFLPAANCEEYYHCLHGVGVLKVCPDNLYWDPVLNVCGWDTVYCQSSENDKDEPNNPALDCSLDDAEFLPYEPDCSKFIQCVFKQPIKQSCPPGLFWNQPLNHCDYVCDFSF